MFKDWVTTSLISTARRWVKHWGLLRLIVGLCLDTGFYVYVYAYNMLHFVCTCSVLSCRWDDDEDVEGLAGLMGSRVELL